MNEEEIIIKLHPIMQQYYEEGTIVGRQLMDYIILIEKLKKINPELAKDYILENNSINVLIKDICAICLEPMTRDQTLCKNNKCEHIFHWNCVQGHGIDKCPICREIFEKRMIQNERLYFGKTLKSDYRYLFNL